jgi:hypothetical protein
MRSGNVFRLPAACVLALGTLVAVVAPAAADQNDDPCDLAATFLCRLVPTAPNLDGDVDLSTAQPVPPGLGPDVPIVDVCASGCS